MGATKVLKIALLVSYMLLRIVLLPFQVLWLMQYPWRAHVIAHLRINTMQSTAMFAERVNLCRFYEFIRMLYNIAMINKPHNKAQYVSVTENMTAMIYRPSVPKSRSSNQSNGDKTAVHVVLHGGGFIYGSPLTVGQFADELCETVGNDVMVLKYPLAPEHKFPAALVSIATAMSKVCSDYERVNVVGASAGANLALGCALLLRDTNSTCKFDSLTLLAGPYSLNTRSRSYQMFANGPKLTKDMVCQYFSLYLRGDYSLYEDLSLGTFEVPALLPCNVAEIQDLYTNDCLISPYAFPLYASSYQGLPQTKIIISEQDLLLCDSANLFSKMQNDRCNVSFDMHAGPHIHLVGGDDHIGKKIIASIAKAF